MVTNHQLAAIWFLATPSLLFSVEFNAPRSYSFGNYQGNCIAAGDFNGDGYQDLAGPQMGDVWIRLSNGDGTLRQAKSYPAGPVNNTVAAAGPSDLVAILLGNGNGSLQPPVQFIVGPCPGAMAVADFDRDGKPDIAVVNACSGQVAILTNTTPERF